MQIMIDLKNPDCMSPEDIAETLMEAFKTLAGGPVETVTIDRVVYQNTEGTDDDQ